MSWEHLKELRDVLNVRLENYESQIGAIRDPSAVSAPEQKAESKPSTKSKKRKPS